MTGGGAAAAAAKRGRSDTTTDGVSFTALHRNRMFHWSPSPVVALAACPGAPLLAVGYETGDLELWDLSLMACIQRVVGEGIEVTSLAWARDTISGTWRTFAAHLDGTISEIDWQRSALVGTLDTAGGVAWALATQPVEAVKPGFPHLIAAACDDGAVRLFGVEGGETGVQLDRTLAVLHGRLLSCAWHPSGEIMAVGGVEGFVHVLDAVGGAELRRITVASSTTSPAPCVWRLLLLADGTLVSGDSEGAVQIWDASFGTLLQRFTRHKADVLALAAAPDGSAIFASGVDSQVAVFEPIPAGAEGAGGVSGGWAYIDNKRPHTHDVRAMEVVSVPGGSPVLVSGGLDTQLVAYAVDTFLQRHPARLSKAPQRPICHLAPLAAAVGAPPRRPHGPAAAGAGAAASHAAPCAPGSGPRLLCSHNDACDVWQLGRHAPVRSIGGAMWSWREQQQPVPAEGSPVDLTASPRHLAQIKLANGARIACSSISPDGSFVACCSGQGAVRLYSLYSPPAPDAGAGKVPLALQPALAVRRVPMPEGTGRAVALALTHRHLVAVAPDGALACYELPPAGAAPAAGAQAGEADEADGEAEEVPSARLVGELPAPEAGSLRLATGKAQGAAPWRSYQSPYSEVVVSPDGKLVALAGPQGVTLVGLPVSETEQPQPQQQQQQRRGRQQQQQQQQESAASTPGSSLRVLGRPLRTGADGPIAGLAFSPDGHRLAAAIASGQLVVWEVEAMRPLQWSLDNEAATHRCLDKLPGPLVGCCFNPDPEVQQLVVFGPGGFCHFDLTSPPSTQHLDAKRKRTRMPQKGAEERQGRNGRAVLLPDPCVFASYLSVDSLMVLEKPWEDVTRKFAPPLLRQRFGT